MKEIIQQRASSWTYWFGLALMMLGYIQQNFTLLAPYLGDNSGFVQVLIGLAVILLREKTKEPLSAKKSRPKARESP